jgi:hypothetical protein
MKKPLLNPDVAELAPSDVALTAYDEEPYHHVSSKGGADWREVSRMLHIDPEQDADRARRAFDSHLARARWMTQQGYRHLLRGGASRNF